MTILMVLEKDFPPDDRVLKEAKSLQESGHVVHIACYTLQNRTKKESWEGITIHRKPISKFTYKSGAACLVLGHYFRFWTRFLEQILNQYHFDAIHIHDLPLSKVGYQLAKKHNLKFVADQHEYYSNWIVHTVHLNTFIGKIVKLLGNWKKYEKKYLDKADLVITVEEPLKECYVNDVGLKPEDIILVPNTPLHSVFNHDNVKESIVKKYENNYMLFYAGGIDVLRGIDICIDALPELVKYIPNIKVVLAGEFWKNCNPIKQAEELGVGHYVEFVGWLDIQDIPSYIAASDICFNVPRVVRDENNNTIATKVYQYIVMGRPVLVGAGKMLKNLILDYNLGLSIKDGDSNDFSQQVLALYTNQDLVQSIKDNSKDMINKFSWEKTIKSLISSYERFQRE